jgi:hypothetical protein
MRGAELRCPNLDCRAMSVDVDPMYEWDERKISISWTCAKGHKWITGMRFEHKSLENMSHGK